MKTPALFEKNLKDGIITKEMLALCIYSVNKRAKNCRDQQELYRFKRITIPYYYDKFHNESKYRQQKEEYYEKKEELLSVLNPDAIHFLKHEHGKIEYFLFYIVGEYSFHSPITLSTINENYPDLDKIELESLNTYGTNITDLISCHFINKVLNAIESGNYTLVD